MQVRFFNESDGKCFSKMADGCACLNRINRGCGTYRCEFYKPQGCEDWVRLDTKYMVRLYAPEELGESRYGKN